MKDRLKKTRQDKAVLKAAEGKKGGKAAKNIQGARPSKTATRR